MNPDDIRLIALAFAAIAVLVVLVTACKLNAFVSLLIASLIVGAGSVAMGRPLASAPGGTVPYTMLGVARSIQEGIGATLGGIAAVLGLGAMLSKLLAESGGAEVLAERFAAFFGRKNIHWCIVALALAVGLTTWFAVGLILLMPILITLARRTDQPFLMLVLPLLSCLSIMHGLMPPHPGPVVAVETLHVGMGLVLFWGFVIGLPAALLAGPMYARFAVRRIHLQVPALQPADSGRAPRAQPPFGLTVFSILLPVGLMLLATLAELVLPPDHTARRVAGFVGHPVVALLTSVVFCFWSFGTRCGYPREDLRRFTEVSVAAIGMTILIVGGGGAFARVLRDSGVADAIGRLGEYLELSPLIYGWSIAAFIRVATGSATVAITTASGLLVPVLQAHPELAGTPTALIVVAIGCGSLFLSHLNDSGFWIVKECLGLSVKQTFATWSMCETIVGLSGLCLCWLCYQFV